MMVQISNPVIDLSLVPQFYKGYVERAVSHNIFHYMEIGPLSDFLKAIPSDKWDWAYAPDKWTVKQVITHIMDSERVFCYRALCFARNDHTPLPGYDHDSWVTAAPTDRSTASIIEECIAVRGASLGFFKNLTDSDFVKTGKANGVEISVGILWYILAGHQMHHFEIIKERYLL